MNRAPCRKAFSNNDKEDSKMITEEKIYRELQQHLDKQAVAFPAAQSGAEIKILKRLFTPEEARLAMHLSYKPRSVQQIYETVKASGMSIHKMVDMLDTMTKNGAIEHFEREGTRYFFNIPFIVGMYERQVYKLTPESIAEFESYIYDLSFGLGYLSTGMSQMRTIPVEKSLPFDRHIATYDNLVETIRKSDGPFVINECLCRKVASMKGKTCQKTHRLETCLYLNNWARNCVKYGMGREISKAEALEITRQNEADGLVIEPTNTQKIEAACACCGCCCGQLGTLKMLPKPIDIWLTNYYAAIDDENCTGCGDCVKRCQVNALSIRASLGIAAINPDRCIGCGVCITSCELEAIRLHKKEREITPPVDMESLYDGIIAKRKGNPS